MSEHTDKPTVWDDYPRLAYQRDILKRILREVTTDQQADELATRIAVAIGP